MKKIIFTASTILTALAMIYGISVLVKKSASTTLWKQIAPAPPEAHTFDDLLDAIEWVESRGDADAIGDGGRAVGAYQIWKIYVDDVNRIQKQWVSVSPGRKVRVFTYEDRLDRGLSRYMVRTFLKHYGGTFEEMTRKHNGGPKGHKKESTKAYWVKVKTRMEKNHENISRH